MADTSQKTSPGQIFLRFRGALSNSPRSSTLWLSVGGIPICLEFENEALRRLLAPAFLHLQAPPCAKPELTILVCEHSLLHQELEELTGAGMAEGDDVWMEEGPQVSILLQRKSAFFAAVEWAEGAAYWVVPSVASIAYVDRAHPLLQLLIYWLGKRERFLVHSAAVGTEQGAVLLLGKGGAGKSTTALSCLSEGMNYLADDFCLVSCLPDPMVHSLYGGGKLAIEGLRSFSALAAAAETSHRPKNEKTLLFFTGQPCLRLCGQLPLRALLLVQVCARPLSSLRPASQAEAFRLLVGSSALHPPRARSLALACFSKLVRALPVYTLELGKDLQSVPATVRDLLARIKP